MQHALNAVQTQTLKPPAAVLQVAPAMLASQEKGTAPCALLALTNKCKEMNLARGAPSTHSRHPQQVFRWSSAFAMKATQLLEMVLRVFRVQVISLDLFSLQLSMIKTWKLYTLAH